MTKCAYCMTEGVSEEPTEDKVVWQNFSVEVLPSAMWFIGWCLFSSSLSQVSHFSQAVKKMNGVERGQFCYLKIVLFRHLTWKSFMEAWWQGNIKIPLAYIGFQAKTMPCQHVELGLSVTFKTLQFKKLILLDDKVSSIVV